jgi:hypothetical protein
MRSEAQFLPIAGEDMPAKMLALEIFEMADRSSLATSMMTSLRSRPELTGEELAAMFRKVADEFRRKADASTSETDKAHWIPMAEEWQALATWAKQPPTKRR